MIFYPYIYTTPRVFAQEAYDFDNASGVRHQRVEGEHSIWAARVPFLPAMMSPDFTRMGAKRNTLVMMRHHRFIYDLARARDNRATFELRFIATPNPVRGQPSLIDVIFLGKTFSRAERRGQELAERLWEKFSSNFPSEEPFNYPLEPVIDEAEFWHIYEPLPFDQITPRSMLEIRKYEDMPIPSLEMVGRPTRIGDYIAHPFVPNYDLNAMGRFMVALSGQDQKCIVGISLRPTRLYDQEIHLISTNIGLFRQSVAEDSDITEEYIRARSRVGYQALRGLISEREQLFTIRVCLVGQDHAPRGLAEALGSEMMGNVANDYPTQWSLLQPGNDKEAGAALDNLRYLEHEPWGHTLAEPALARLRYFATALEASGAFRLPVPPESGYMPGILVKDEPFVAPADELELRAQARANREDPDSTSAVESRKRKVDLGVVYHRGSPTAQVFQLNVGDLNRHGLIAGSTGSGKSTTIKHILGQLWQRHEIPFLVLYPIDKPDYRDLRGIPGLSERLLIFTLGDTTSPFRFNPFEVPDGLLLKTHLSRLMRVFTAAFSLADPLPMIYREALRQVYRDYGWDTIEGKGTSARDYPIMSDFMEAIRAITDSLKYGRETQDNVRQASVIRIGDLLENAGYVINVRRSMPLSHILNEPTVMELGRVGSMQDTSLLMGFLLMRFAEEVERHPRPRHYPHITVVEEAHRLMAETSPVVSGAGDSRGAAGEDFSNLLSEVRGYGEGILIAEQIPTLLVKGAIGNTYVKIMHWLEDAPSFDLFGNIMNLSAGQREYARSLTPGFAVVRNAFGRPVHVKVPEFGEQPGFDKVIGRDISDETIGAYMAERRETLGLSLPTPEKWSASLSAGAFTPSDMSAPKRERKVLDLILTAPMPTCAHCPALHQTGICAFGQMVRRKFMFPPPDQREARVMLDEALGYPTLAERWVALNHLAPILACHFPERASPQRRGVAYCILAHEVDDIIRTTSDQKEAAMATRANARALLSQFESQYAAG